MEFTAHTKDGKLIMSRDMADMRDHYVHKWKDGTQVRIEIVRVGRNKTVQQLRTHWGLVIGTIRREFDERGMDLATFLRSETIPEGQPVPADVIQAVLYACCNDIGENGERKTLSKMSTWEASQFFDRCRNYAASAWNIQIPDPAPTWKEQGGLPCTP
jgi:hypothetical protein